jgi:hypothetical protein
VQDREHVKNADIISVTFDEFVDAVIACVPALVTQHQNSVVTVTLHVGERAGVPI